MRSIALSFCLCALAACASGKSAEPEVEESPREQVEYENRVEQVRESGDYTIEAEREREDRADRKRAKSEKRDGDRKDGDRKTDEAKDERKEPVAADDTGKNERDEAPGALMPTDQGESESDIEITQKIRRAVMDDDSLSFTAKNIKIITQDGKVTLRGPVKSAHERNAIGAAAKEAAPGRVDNQLEIAN